MDSEASEGSNITNDFRNLHYILKLKDVICTIIRVQGHIRIRKTKIWRKLAKERVFEAEQENKKQSESILRE
jgi:hypothetical protein